MPEFMLLSNTPHGHNLFAYCENEPVVQVDYSGFAAGAIALGAAAAVIGKVAATLAKVIGVVLKVTAVFLLILGALISIIQFIQALNAYIKSMPKTKTLPDVKAKIPDGKVYYLAYITSKGALKKIGKAMNFVSALAALGVTGATNSLNKKYKYDPGKSSNAQRTLQHLGSEQWGIYTHAQSAAKALAVVFGYSKKPEVHAPGMYGHYHVGYYVLNTGEYKHVFHIWYGGVLNY